MYLFLYYKVDLDLYEFYTVTKLPTFWQWFFFLQNEIVILSYKLLRSFIGGVLYFCQ